MSRFIFIRHAKAGIPGIYYGRSDVPVTPEGMDQEDALLSDLADYSFHRILSSPLSRCRNLAQRIADSQNRPLGIEAELTEIHLGDWEGRSFDEASNLYQDIAQQLFEYTPTLTFPNGESLQGFRDRIAKAWEHLASQAGPTQNILVLAHAGVIRALLANLSHGDTRDFWAPVVDNCSATIIQTSNGSAQIRAVGVPSGELMQHF